jgi:hypothetical protein
MLCFDDDAALAHLLIAATAIPVRARARWLRGIAAQFEPPRPQQLLGSPSPASNVAAHAARARQISNGAARTRLHRSRQANGRAVLRICVDLNAVSAALAEAGLLSETEIDDTEAVGRALEKVVALLPVRL